MAIRYAPEPAKPVVRKPPIPAEVGIPATKKRTKTGGRKPSADPTVVLTLRVPRSVADGLKPGWRQRVAALLASEAP